MLDQLNRKTEYAPQTVPYFSHKSFNNIQRPVR